MNQSQEVFKSLLNSKLYQVDFLEFPCNQKNLSLFKNTSLLDYKNILKTKLDSSNYDFILAHSLGGLIFCELVCEDQKYLEHVKKVNILGCALSGKINITFISLFPKYFKVISLNKKKFRVHSFCYAFMYREIYQIQSKLDLIVLGNLEALSFYFDPRDELLDVSIFRNFKNAKEYLCKDHPKHLYYDFIEKLALGHLLF